MKEKHFGKAPAGKVPERQTIVELISVHDLLDHAGNVVKYTYDDGKTWRFARLNNGQELQMFSNGERGVATYVEISEEGVHMRSAITRRDFGRPGFSVFTTSTEEVTGKKFSYGM